MIPLTKCVWNTGDLVRLKSGGPIMTVQHKTNGRTNEYRCAWFDTELKIHSSVFIGDALLCVQFRMHIE